MSPRAPRSGPTHHGPSDPGARPAGRDGDGPEPGRWSVETWMILGVALFVAGLGIVIAAREGTISTQTLAAGGGYAAAIAALAFAVERPRNADRVGCVVLAVGAFAVATAIATG
jgi:hypothetical protein